MLEAGVRGYCTVDIDPELLKKAVQMVHKGEIWVGRKFISQLLDALVSLTEKQRAKSIPKLVESLERLTPREREIVELLGVGASNKARLHLALFVNGHKPESV